MTSLQRKQGKPMDIGETEIIDQRETGNYMSGEAWPEFLVLEKLGNNKFRMDIKRKEVIDDAHNYCAVNGLIDDDGNITPPTQIDGKDVYVDDGYIYSDDLVQVDDDGPEVIFTSPDQDAVMDWCKRNEWDYDRIIKSLVQECSGSKQSSNKKPAKKKSGKKKPAQEEQQEQQPSLGESVSPERAKMFLEMEK